MRPSKNKTPLAKLRSVLTEEITVRDRKGRNVRKSQKLPIKIFADWLRVSVSAVQGIESGKWTLTEENAEIISNQTGVSDAWLLSGKPKTTALNWYNKPYSQSDFERRQNELKKRGRNHAVALLRFELAKDFAKVAEILLLAHRQDKLDYFASKVKTALGNIRNNLTSQPSTLVGFCLECNTRSVKSNRLDLKPVISAWEANLKTASG